MIIDHICFMVEDLQVAIKFWEDVFGYKQMTNIVSNTLQQVDLVFLKKDNSTTIKLIKPIKPVKLTEVVDHHHKKGFGFHHICFRCSDVRDAMDSLKQKGLITLVEPQPAEGFDHEMIAFMMTKFALKIELIDTDKKAKPL